MQLDLASDIEAPLTQALVTGGPELGFGQFGQMDGLAHRRDIGPTAENASMDPVMPIGGPYFYSYFAGRGRELLAETLGAPDPFSLPGAEIVERVLAAGYTPDLASVRRTPFPTADAISAVDRDGQHFIVSIDVEAETIGVQEQRADAYGPE